MLCEYNLINDYSRFFNPENQASSRVHSDTVAGFIEGAASFYFDKSRQPACRLLTKGPWGRFSLRRISRWFETCSHIYGVGALTIEQKVSPRRVVDPDMDSTTTWYCDITGRPLQELRHFLRW